MAPVILHKTVPPRPYQRHRCNFSRRHSHVPLAPSTTRRLRLSHNSKRLRLSHKRKRLPCRGMLHIKGEQVTRMIVTRKSRASPEQVVMAICEGAEAEVLRAKLAQRGTVETSAQSQKGKWAMVMRAIGSVGKQTQSYPSNTLLGKTRIKTLLYGLNSSKQR